MAISFSRPDPSSPRAVAAASFSTARRGFDQDEVRELLRMVAAELGRLQERERFLGRELRESQRNPHATAVAIDEEVVTKLLGEEATRILQVAREAAAKIKLHAEEGAARMLREATDEARRLREESEVEASRRRTDAAADAEAELNMAKQQGRDMVNEARAYRERVLSELSRRRELARQQIEQLVHGRDRLLQAFERARLAAVDVMSELTPLGTPSEYVNLAPTTGPVPVMVSATAPAPASAPPVPAAETPREAVDEMMAQVDALIPAPADLATETADDDDAADEETAVDAAVAEDTAETDAPDRADDVDESIAESVDDDDDDVTAGASVTVLRTAGVGAAPDDEDSAPARVVPLFDAATSAPEVMTTHDDGVDTDADVDADVDVDTGASAPTGRDDTAAIARGADSVFAQLRASRIDDVARAVRERTGIVDERDERDEVAPDPADATDSVFRASAEEPDADATDAAVGHDADDDAAPAPSAFERRDAQLTPLVARLARRVKRVLADEQNEILHQLQSGEPVHAVDDLLGSGAERRERYGSSLESDLRAAALAGAASLDLPGHPRSLDLHSAVAAAIDVLDTAIVAPLRERVEMVVGEVGDDAEELSAHLRSVYREWKTQRIDDHIDDVARTAYARGQYLALAPGTPVRWIVDPNGPACPDAEDNSLAGVVAAGDPFPTNDVFPPAHPGCRCLLARAEADATAR